MFQQIDFNEHGITGFKLGRKIDSSKIYKKFEENADFKNGFLLYDVTAFNYYYIRDLQEQQISGYAIQDVVISTDKKQMINGIFVFFKAEDTAKLKFTLNSVLGEQLLESQSYLDNLSTNKKSYWRTKDKISVFLIFFEDKELCEVSYTYTTINYNSKTPHVGRITK